jgi:hypothetical protein
VGFVVDKVALGRFSPSTSVSPANIIPPLVHIHLSPPHEVCDRSDQAAHYHNLGPQLGASLLTQHIGWKQKKKEKKLQRGAFSSRAVPGTSSVSIDVFSFLSTCLYDMPFLSQERRLTSDVLLTRD